MILLNAVYFKGDWKTEFDSNATESKTFYYCKSGRGHVIERYKSIFSFKSIYYCKNDKKPADKKKVLTMSAKNRFLIGNIQELGASFVQLPYKVYIIVKIKKKH